MDSNEKQIKKVLSSKIIDVGNNLKQTDGSWSFAEETVLHFDEHIEHSIPNYKDAHKIVTAMSDHFVSNGSIIYDVGCSTGTLTRSLAYNYMHRKPKIIGLDSVKEMIDKSREQAKLLIDEGANLTYQCCDILEFEMEKANLITCVFTLQFIHQSLRKEALKKIYQQIKPGGAFIWLEKVRAPTPRLQDLINNAYMKFKLDNFEPTEILAKTFSLTSVMDPLTSEQNHNLLREVGFDECAIIFKSYCFEGILATKNV